ncbi:hypothetical protein FQR65_LT08940 [Abscondita terminalis]|nr:hypothetical protein FQR65_LT08940 [Abscondita terminalis]
MDKKTIATFPKTSVTKQHLSSSHGKESTISKFNKTKPSKQSSNCIFKVPIFTSKSKDMFNLTKLRSVSEPLQEIKLKTVDEDEDVMEAVTLKPKADGVDESCNDTANDQDEHSIVCMASVANRVTDFIGITETDIALTKPFSKYVFNSGSTFDDTEDFKKQMGKPPQTQRLQFTTSMVNNKTLSPHTAESGFEIPSEVTTDINEFVFYKTDLTSSEEETLTTSLKATHNQELATPGEISMLLELKEETTTVFLKSTNNKDEPQTTELSTIEEGTLTTFLKDTTRNQELATSSENSQTDEIISILYELNDETTTVFSESTNNKYKPQTTELSTIEEGTLTTFLKDTTRNQELATSSENSQTNEVISVLHELKDETTTVFPESTNNENEPQTTELSTLEEELNNFLKDTTPIKNLQPETQTDEISMLYD